MTAIDGEIVSEAPEGLRNVTPDVAPLVTPPIYLDFGPQAAPFGGFSGGDGLKCSPLTWLAIGAVAMFVIPPFLGGVVEGARDAWDDRER